jgi:putative ABC transport system permease protein
MLKSFFLTARRMLSKNRAYSFLNIFGLAIGIACAGLIFLWVGDELSYDHANVNRDRLYMVLENEVLANEIRTHPSTPGPMAPVMKTELTGIANTCRATEAGAPQLFTIGDRTVLAAGKYVDSSIFSMFTLPFVQGNAHEAFSKRYSIVLTESTARKFFGADENVVGKIVRMDNNQNYVVGGVIRDLPLNSSLQFEWVAPFDIFFQQNDYIRKWGNNSLTTYVMLDPATNPASVNQQLTNYIQKRESHSNIHLLIFGMNDWRLHWQFENGKQTGGGRIAYVHLFSVIAWIILFIACINFMNLATARSEQRAKEVGVRKVLGAGKGSLIAQFMGEALVMSLLATIVAAAVIALLLPYFNVLVQKSLSLELGSPLHLAALLLIAIVCGLVAGSYPALYLSSFNPAAVLKASRLKAGGAVLVRKGLVVLQFTISIVLIIATLIIYQQLQHVRSRELGFNKDNLLEIDVQGSMGTHFDVIRQDLINTSVVKDAALSDHPTIYGGNNTDGFTWQGKDPGSRVLISNRYISPEFFATSGMKLLEGRDIRRSDTMSANRIGVVITASLEKMLGKGSAVSKFIWFEGDTAHKAVVVGVVNDYVYGDMYGQPDPVMFLYGPVQNASVMYVRTAAQKAPNQAQSDPALVLAKIEAVLKKDNPGYPPQYRFVDDQFNGMFTNETLIGTLSQIFAALAIVISCLGLFGLAAYTVERRIKEIGIRKILGASVTGITGLLSRDFMQLVGLSILIAFPVAWWLMNHWLQDYAYRTTIQWWVFAAAGGLALLITLATVGLHALRAARANPIKTLRTE